MLQDKLGRVRFFTSGIPFLALSDVDMRSVEKELPWRRYIMQRPCLLGITKRVELLMDGDLQPWRHTENLAPMQKPLRNLHFAKVLAPGSATELFKYGLVRLSGFLVFQTCQLITSV